LASIFDETLAQRRQIAVHRSMTAFTHGVSAPWLAGRIGCPLEDAGVALAVMSFWLTWAAAAELLGVSPATARQRVIGECRRIATALPLSTPADARLLQIKELPEVVYMVDCFPVACRGPPKLYNGKYNKMVFKFQAVTDLNGNIVAVLPAGLGRDRAHDSKVFKKLGTE
jgi:hypothetical protein